MLDSHCEPAIAEKTRQGQRQLESSVETVPGDLESLIKSRVEERTHRGIRDLRVEQADGGVILSGRADRYYLVQLALAGAQEVLRRGAVRLSIAVGMSDGRAGQ